jgi:Dolichyl-phosphate-mannose-protein mannosyltransferase
MDYGRAAGSDSPPPPPADPPALTAEPRSALTVGRDASPRTGTGLASYDFAESQRAGLGAIFGLTQKSGHWAPDSPAGRAQDLTLAAVRTHADRTGILARPVPVPEAARITLLPLPQAAPDDSDQDPRRFAHLPGLCLMVIILTVQAALSVRFLRADTAFGDEALYLWAGHLEWAHWLHGTHIPAFATWFSGSPVVYPPIGALADRLGGLVAARLLSLCFMLGATCLLWATTSRLFGRRAAYFAAALFAVIGPTLHLGAFATYDAMALFLLALAAWCACGARTSEDATGWILGSAAALALANATKYASAIFDPLVLLMAVLSAYPLPGGKAALRRGALLLTALAGMLAVLLRLGGSWYVTGISQTTTMRPDGQDPIAKVLTESWEWTTAVLVAALAGVALSIARKNVRAISCLIAALAAAALLVPIEQARIHTAVSLAKHLDFGAWFACIACGFALGSLASWPRPRIARTVAAVCLSAALVPVAAAGIAQARAMINWPGAAHLIAFLKPLTRRGGHFLAETNDVPEYYLPATSWRQWSNTFSITRSDGRIRDVKGSVAPYARAIRHHYFSLVILSFSETPAMDRKITVVLAATPGYKILGTITYGGPIPGSYTVWAYRPATGQGGS